MKPTVWYNKDNNINMKSNDIRNHKEEETIVKTPFWKKKGLDLDKIVELEEDESINQLEEVEEVHEYNLELDTNEDSLHKEILWEELELLMSKKDLKDRKITDFCGHYIYGENNNNPEICNKPNCSYIHSNDITKFKHYLNNQKVKSYQCMDPAKCNYFVCLFRHPADNLIMKYSKINENDLKYITPSMKINRNIAAKIHKKHKQTQTITQK